MRSMYAVRLFALLVFASVLSTFSAAEVNRVQASHRAAIAQEYGKIPLSFEANQGQSNGSVRFLSRGDGYGVFLTDSGAVLALGRGGGQSVVEMTLAGAASAGVRGEEELPGKVNYFVGNDPKRWRVDLPTFARVRYSGVYPGVDLVYYGNQRQLEYDFVVAPGASYEAIRLHFKGSERVRIADNGDLLLGTGEGAASFHKPVIYQLKNGQLKNGQREEIAGRFDVLADNTVGFQIGKYDHSRELVIDPVLVYSTYLGGSKVDTANAIAVDSNGSAYVAGSTTSPDFPIVAGAYQSAIGVNASQGSVGFISKLTPDGTGLVYSTYLGGANQYNAGTINGIALGSDGSVFVAGQTNARDYPVTHGAFQTRSLDPTFNGFVTKLNAAGNALVYSTYLGGPIENKPNIPNGDSIAAIAVNSAGEAFVTGLTTSMVFPTTQGAFQTVNHDAQGTAFVSKLNAAGSDLLYSTYLGGSGGGIESNHNGWNDGGAAITVDADGDAYVTGYTFSSDFPVTAGAFQTTNHAQDPIDSNVFVTKLSPDGTSLLYSTYLGGTAEYYAGSRSSGQGIVVDGSGSAYVTGVAYGTDFPVTSGAYETKNQNVYQTPGACFVTKFKPDGKSLAYSTYLTKNYETWDQLPDRCQGIVVDGTGETYVVGTTGSESIPTTVGALQTSYDLTPTGFLAKFDAAGHKLLYSTLIGQHGTGNAIALDTLGAVYVAGGLTTDLLPTLAGAFQPVRHGVQQNAFIAKFNLGTGAPAPSGTAVAMTTSEFFFIHKSPLVTAAVTAAGSTAIPTGNVNFLVDGADVGTFALDGTGKASFTPSPLAAGVHTLVANYQGSSTLDPSRSVLYPNSTANDGIYIYTFTPTQVAGAPLNFLISLYRNSQQGSTLVDGAQLSILVDGVPFDTVTSRSDTNEIYSTSSIPLGTHTFTVTYPGSSELDAATHSVTITIRGPLFTALSGPQTLMYGNATPDQLSYKVVQLNGKPADFQTFHFSGPGLNLSWSSYTAGISNYGYVNITCARAGDLTLTATTSWTADVLETPITCLKAPLVVTTPSILRVYGSPIPAISTYHVHGFVYSDVQATSMSGVPTITTTATSSSPVGAYPITISPGSLASSNYSFQLTPNILTIVRAPLSLSATDVIVPYGQQHAQLSGYKLTGFVNGENASIVTGAPVLLTNVTPATPAGYYSIQVSPGTLAAPNYFFTVFAHPGVVHVTKAPLMVVADNVTIARGGPIPALTYHLAGFVNGDTAASAVTGSAFVKTNAGANTRPGTYPIYISKGTLASPNYEFQVVAGTLTITP